MARVTVEDCLEFVENRFELVLVAAKRAHQLSTGGYKTTLDRKKDKPAVIALREIEAGLIDSSILTEQYMMPGDSSIDKQKQDEAMMKEVEAELTATAIDTDIDGINEIEQEAITEPPELSEAMPPEEPAPAPEKPSEPTQ